MRQKEGEQLNKKAIRCLFRSRISGFFHFVCRACSSTRRCKSAMGVGICEPLAEGKGVHGDVESEGSPRQILGLRYTNHI